MMALTVPNTYASDLLLAERKKNEKKKKRKKERKKKIARSNTITHSLKTTYRILMCILLEDEYF